MRSIATPPLFLVLLMGSVPLAGMARGADRVDPNNPPQGLFADDWMEIHFAGGKVGYGHASMKRKGDVIHTVNEMRLRFGRADQAVEMAVSETTQEAVDGAPRAFSSETDLSLQSSHLAGVVKDGKVTITTSQFGLEREKVYDFPPGALMAWGAYREGLLRGYKPGTRYTLELYAPQMMLNGAVSARVVIGDWEPYEHRGETHRGMRVTMTMEMPAGTFEMISWVDGDGDVLRAEVPFPGLGNMQLFTVDEATALGDFIPPEVFLTTAIKVPPIDARKVRAIKFRVSLTDDGAGELDLPTTGMQTPKAIDRRTAELIVMRQRHSGGATPGKSMAPDVKECLGGNLMINIDDPELIRIAKEAAGDATEPFALADNLRRFARTYISKKSLDIGFATASEVARTREGDCSEHGVFLAALGRINGLPSRVVVGLAYAPVFGGRRDIMGYHMWTQFFIEGAWYDFDAALGDEREPAPTRIAFALSSLKDAGLADLSLPLIGKMGAIQVEVLEVR
jgi:transglutaminase-like putative cysteine protease